MAAVFLVLLYNSPAGLVLYWTMNNIFSLIKTVFYKLKDPLKVLYIICCAAVIGMDYFILFHHDGLLYRRLMLIIVLSSVILIPLILKLINFLISRVFNNLENDNKECFTIFIISGISLCLLLGLFIPSTVIVSSPQEFAFIDSVKNPLTYINTTFWKCFGLCIFWPVCIYFLFQNKRVKTCISIFFVIIVLGALINVFAFHGNYGTLTPIMMLDNAEKLTSKTKENIINLLVLIIPIIVIFVTSFFKREKLLLMAISFIGTSILILSFANIVKINKEVKNYEILLSKSASKKDTISPIFHLSKTEKNVFIIDLDRAVGAYFPEILNEKPELKTIFDGFIYYPNTASFGNRTLIGSPAMFGGYDYTPKAIMLRKNDSLLSKHNEALLSMPVLFGENGYNVTLTDPSFANYSLFSDLSIYENYDYITAHNTIRAYTDLWISEHPDLAGRNLRSKLVKRNIFWYSLLRSFPTLFRDTIYNGGDYWNSQKSEKDLQAAVNNFAVLDYLPALTDFSSDKPSYTFMVNELPHEPAYFQAPDYLPSKYVTDIGSSKYKNDIFYHVNISSILRIGKWIEYLKQSGVYNNTKIIVISDHGNGVTTDTFGTQKKGSWNRYESYNPILLVKDFNQTGELKTSTEFMTNADLAALSCKNIINNPINPFTKNPITTENKKNGIACLNNVGWSPDAQNKNTFRVNNWFTIKDNIFDNNNWNEATEEEIMAGDYQ